jgi:hypothetical protein
MIIDILFTVGSLGFVIADVKQLYKLIKTNYAANAISKTHLKIKLLSLVCVTSGYLLSNLHMSAVVSSTQLILVLGIWRYTLLKEVKL